MFYFCFFFPASWLQKKTKNIWRKRWYEVNDNKLAWYTAANKKQEIGNLPLFLIVGVEDGAKPTQFRIKTKDTNKPEVRNELEREKKSFFLKKKKKKKKKKILLQAASSDQKAEWIKTVSALVEQRKLRVVEEAEVGGAPRPSSLVNVASASASDASYDRDDVVGAEDDAHIEAPRAIDAVHGSYLTKAAHEKFAVSLRQLVLDQDVGGVRAMLDPRPPRDALIWFFQKELDRTVLHFAVENGDLKVTDLLVSQEPRLLELIDHLGFTPLHVAAYKGHVEMGELLLKLGANPVCSDNSGRIPVYVALAAGHHAFAKMLLKKNAAGPGWLPVHLAAIGGVKAHLVSFSSDDLKAEHVPSKVTPLHLAASSDSVGSAEAVLHLIESGANVNAVDFMGKTPLFFAASCGALQPLRVLLGKVKKKEEEKKKIFLLNVFFFKKKRVQIRLFVILISVLHFTLLPVLVMPKLPNC